MALSTLAISLSIPLTERKIENLNVAFENNQLVIGIDGEELIFDIKLELTDGSDISFANLSTKYSTISKSVPIENHPKNKKFSLKFQNIPQALQNKLSKVILIINNPLSQKILSTENNMLVTDDFTIDFQDAFNMHYNLNITNSSISIYNITPNIISNNLLIDPNITLTTNRDIKSLQVISLLNQTLGVVYCDENNDDIWFQTFFANGTNRSANIAVDRAVTACYSRQQTSIVSPNGTSVYVHWKTYSGAGRPTLYRMWDYDGSSSMVSNKTVSVNCARNDGFVATATINSTYYASYLHPTTSCAYGNISYFREYPYNITSAVVDTTDTAVTMATIIPFGNKFLAISTPDGAIFNLNATAFYQNGTRITSGKDVMLDLTPSNASILVFNGKINSIRLNDTHGVVAFTSRGGNQGAELDIVQFNGTLDKEIYVRNQTVAGKLDFSETSVALINSSLLGVIYSDSVRNNTYFTTYDINTWEQVTIDYPLRPILTSNMPNYTQSVSIAGYDYNTNISLCQYGKAVVAFINSTNSMTTADTIVLRTINSDGTEWNGSCNLPISNYYYEVTQSLIFLSNSNRNSKNTKSIFSDFSTIPTIGREGNLNTKTELSFILSDNDTRRLSMGKVINEHLTYSTFLRRLANLFQKTSETISLSSSGSKTQYFWVKIKDAFSFVLDVFRSIFVYVPPTPVTPSGGGGGGSAPTSSCGDGICWYDENITICPNDCMQDVIINAPNVWYTQHETLLTIKFFNGNGFYAATNLSFNFTPNVNITTKKIEAEGNSTIVTLYVPKNTTIGNYVMYLQSGNLIKTFPFQISEKKEIWDLFNFIKMYKRIFYGVAIAILLVIIGIAIYLDSERKKHGKK